MQASASFLQFFRIPATGFDSSLTERNGQAGERDRRDFRRMTGRVQLMGERVIPGPYTKEWRERWVRRVLEAQASARREGPAEFRSLQLIAPEHSRLRSAWRMAFLEVLRQPPHGQRRCHNAG